VPSSGIRQQLEQIRFERLVRAVHLVDQEHGRLRATDCLEQRALQQIALGENILLLEGNRALIVLEQLDGEQLPLVVPFVHRRMHVEPLVTLKADELGAAYRGERLRDFGLAHAGIALQQQRATEIQHQQERSRERTLGDVTCAMQLALQIDDLVHALRRRIHTVLLRKRPRSQSLNTAHMSARPFSSCATGVGASDGVDVGVSGASAPAAGA
jgi:hypothetical protein